MFNAKVEIVFDPSKNKLRAKAINLGGWVRFPKKLRIEGAIYKVSELREGRSGSWIACGDIRRVQAA